MPPRVPSSDLPVETCVPALRRALAEVGQAVLVAPPGAGKTTIVPLRLLDERWLGGERIVMLEPRRLAARAAARRMAWLVDEAVGETVGYTTRDEHRVGRATRIEVVTEGILTRRLQRDPSLPGVGLVVFDECHERNLATDLALALLLDARPALRPDLRLLAMSATLEAARVAALLGGAPVVESEGRAHEVTVRWLPRRPSERLAAAAAAAVERALAEEPGDVLVFLPGAAEIRRVEADLTTRARPPGVDVRPLFGALTAAEQDAALAPSPPGRRRVVLATDIAETSLTVDGVRIVVDGGESRTPRFDVRSGLTRLRTGPISRASAEQRAGRAGRHGPGVAYRLWSVVEHAGRRPQPEPEITAVDLTGLALELAVWGADPADLAFLDPPPRRALDEARALLALLGALDAGGRPTPLGRAMAELPLHPRLARLVVGAAADEGWTACILAALLADRDVLRGRPDELPIDVADRVALIGGSVAAHPRAEQGAVRATARRAAELARRAGVSGRVVEVHRCGAVLALAYPDRLAQARGGARFRLRTGAGAWVPAGDPLAGEALLVVAELDAGRGDGRVRLAAGIDAADVEERFAGGITETVTVAWDPNRDDLRARVERRLGSLVLGATDGPARPGPATARALVARARATSLAALRWTATARALQQRAGFARRTLGTTWPDLSDAALAASLEEWVAPLLATAVGRAGLEAVDLEAVLRARLGPRLVRELDRVAPAGLVLAGGRRAAIDYGGDGPAVSVRVQELFGTEAHPTVGGGRVPLVLHLLSPAGRPVQVTADLPGFWSGSWASVRKEMAGRYPKHPWPLDPRTAAPPPGRSGTARRR